MPLPSRWREHLLGVFVLYHLAAVVLGSVPAAVGGLNRKSWKNPVVADELDSWHHTLQGLGLAADREAFEDALFKVAVRSVRLRKDLIVPFRPYYNTAGTSQDWRMFVAPMTRPAALRIEGRTSDSDDWMPLYVHHSVDHDFSAAQLRYARMRPVLFRLAWPRYKPDYQRFGKAMARRAFESDPSLDAVQLVWERRKSPGPKARSAPPIARERPLPFTRAELGL